MIAIIGATLRARRSAFLGVLALLLKIRCSEVSLFRRRIDGEKQKQEAHQLIEELSEQHDRLKRKGVPVDRLQLELELLRRRVIE